MHVSQGDGTAKLWLDPVRFVYSNGFTPAELRRVRELTALHAPEFMEAWHERFGRR